MSAGHAPEPVGARFLRDFQRRVARARIPLDGSLELTHRCNLRCVHCYLGDQDAIRRHRRDELDTAEVKDVIDQVVAAGALNLLLSGGDPMVRRDFCEIYEHAVRRGLRVTVYCDAVLVTERVVEALRRHPPFKVEVSLYGATRETYEAITQVPGSFERCLAGIDRLVAAGVRVRLKTVLMTANRHELEAMERLAEERGLGFYFDTAVFPCLPHRDNGGGANRPRARRTSVAVAAPALERPTGLRLDPEAAAEARLASPARRAEAAEVLRASRALAPTDRLYTCGAAQTTFHVDPYGNLQACTISTNVRYSLREGSFLDGWNGPLARLRELAADPDLPCGSCELRALCSGCPAMFEAETGSADGRVAYHCRTTHALAARLEAGAPARPAPQEDAA